MSGPSFIDHPPAYFDRNRSIDVGQHAKVVFTTASQEEPTMITCFIRYEIDPFKKEAFAEYARNWGQAIPRCGADLIGYFGPHEGSATMAYGVYNIENLAAYEQYRARLVADQLGIENYEFARRERFILKEDRLFLKCVSTPHAQKVAP
jgi:hypothetical protein